MQVRTIRKYFDGRNVTIIKGCHFMPRLKGCSSLKAEHYFIQNKSKVSLHKV